ncbi:hypothetical protein GGI35DRAFT_440168 [Trichoderma velutinum]
MPSRPLLTGDSTVLQRRRQQAREAQQRLRKRRLHTLSELENRNKILEQGIHQLLDSFAQFSDQVSMFMNTHADNGTLCSFRDALKTFTEIATYLSSHSCDREEISDCREEIREARLSVTPVDPSSLSSLMAMTRPHHKSREAWSSEIEPQRANLEKKKTAQTLDQPAYISPIIQLMLTSNPMLTEDFWSLSKANAENLVLWQRLFYSTMIISYQQLSVVQKKGALQSSSWLSRAHKFSLRRSSPLALISLTAIGLQVAAMECKEGHLSQEPRLGPAPASKNKQNVEHYFDVERYHMLGTTVREDMAAEGIILDNIINAEEVEQYLRERGMMGYDKHKIYLKLSADNPWCKHLDPKSHGPILVVIGLGSFIRNMMDASLCLGDAIGYYQNSIDLAVIHSKVRLVPMGFHNE